MNDTMGIYTYTRQDAIADGVFVDVTEQAKKAGFKIPVAITTNLFDTFIRSANSEEDTARRLEIFLKQMHTEVLMADKDDNMLTTKIYFDDKIPTDVWAVIEAQSPSDPSPALNIFLPVDY
jgi:hypothetical protein